MNCRAYRTILLAITLAVGCGKKKSDDDGAAAPESSPALAETDREGDEVPSDAMSRLLGYAEISKMIEASMLDTWGGFSLASFVDTDFSSGPGMSALMGYFNDDPLNPTWRNTTPNPIGLSTYLMAYTAFASEMAYESCGIGSISQRRAFASAKTKYLLGKLCVSASAMSDDDKKALWTTLSLGTAPAKDFNDWKADLALTEGMSPEKRLEFVIQTTLSSPWVLTHF